MDQKLKQEQKNKKLKATERINNKNIGLGKVTAKEFPRYGTNNNS